MNHPDDNELFHRLEAEMAADSGAEVVDLNKARSARGESTGPAPDSTADSRPSESADPRAHPAAPTVGPHHHRHTPLKGARPAPAGPGQLDPHRAGQRRA
ncbi:cell division protein FtsK, partial [Streptomyces sp. NPDC018957]